MYYLIGILVLLIIYVLVIYNKLVKNENKVEEAFSTMDVYLKKRWDLIPSLVEIVKGYAKHEKSTLEEIMNLRNKVYDQMKYSEKIQTNNEVSKGVAKLIALVESYPDLKANEQFKALSGNLSLVEDEIAKSRKYYNAVVRDYNNIIEMFPSNIVASIIGKKTKLMFSIDEKNRESVKVKL